MQRNKRWMVSGLAAAMGIVLTSQPAIAAEQTYSMEVNNLIAFQCEGAKTLKDAEANYARMAKRFTDVHPVMECLKKKIETLKASSK